MDTSCQCTFHQRPGKEEEEERCKTDAGNPTNRGGLLLTTILMAWWTHSHTLTYTHHTTHTQYPHLSGSLEAQPDIPDKSLLLFLLLACQANLAVQEHSSLFLERPLRLRPGRRGETVTTPNTANPSFSTTTYLGNAKYTHYTPVQGS